MMLSSAVRRRITERRGQVRLPVGHHPGQIEAFRAEDGARAYGYAAPMIKQIFPNPDVFMNMVRQGYQPVYRPQSFTFGEAGFSASGRPIQKVTVVGPDGITYEAIYTMERQPDGTWQISGCAIVRAPDLGRVSTSGFRRSGGGSI